MKKLMTALTLLMTLCSWALITENRVGSQHLVFRVHLEGRLEDDGTFMETGTDWQEWSLEEEPGAPALPYKILRIAVPPQGDLRFSTSIIESKTESLSKPLKPAPLIIEGNNSSEFIFNIDEDKYRRAEKPLVEKGEPYNHNGYRLIPLTLNPVSYNWDKREIIWHKVFEISIKIEGNTNWRSEQDSNKSWLDKEFIANYEQARFWREDQVVQPSGIDWQRSQFWYKVEISESGAFYLTEDALADLPDFAEPALLRLFSLEPEMEFGKRIFQSNEIALFELEKSVYFNYAGNSSVLWLALGGEFDLAPLRSQNLPDTWENIEKITPRTDHSRRGRAVKCLMIRPAGYFESQAEELIEFHAANFGLETAIAIQEDIFAEQSGGEPNPLAINSFLETYYYENPTLDYVLLLGSGTENFSNSTAKNKIITIRRSSFAADDFFVDFNYDNVPELSIGRIPAQNESMMDNYMQRLHQYVEDQEKGWWQNRVLLVADDENKTGGLEGTTPGSGMNHTQRMEDATQALSGRLLQKLYGINYPFDTYKNKPGVTQDMIGWINEGAVITYYIGHGSWDNLGDEEYFSIGDIQFLENYQHLTQFLAASCNVGHFDLVGTDCMAELFLFSENGGAISSIAASESSGPTSNAQLMQAYLHAVSNLGMTTGKALQYAKTNSSASISNSNRYNLLGNPVLHLPLPVKIGNITGLPDSLLRRQTVNCQGNFDSSRLQTSGQMLAFDSRQMVHYSNFIPPDTTIIYEADYLSDAQRIFRGDVQISSGTYSSSFIIPDDADSGSYGEIMTLAHDEDGSWLNQLSQIVFADSAQQVENTDAPQIAVYLDSRNFRSGDAVSSTPLVIADIHDSNGINISGSPGRSILALLDDSNDQEDLIDVTDGFVYEPGSCTAGIVNWELPELDKGDHNLKIIVYDNFGAAAVAETEFKVVVSGSLSISDMLPYPNPMSDSGWFTFVLTGTAEINISIFTISGKKVKTISDFADTGYNQIAWDCRDADGDRLANNTYFYKIKAKDSQSGNSTEKTGKLIILN